MALPQMHGRTHCPGGSDPIPCLPGPWMRIEKTYASTLQVVLGNNGFNDVHCGVGGDGINIAGGDSGQGFFEEYVDGSNNIIGITCLVQGLHQVTGELLWNEAHTFDWGIGFTDDSDNSHYAMGLKNPAQQVMGMFSMLRRTRANETLIFNTFQGSGVNKNIDAAYMEVVRIGGYTGTDYINLDPAQ